MAEKAVVLFSEAALSVLNSMPYDPKARGRYEYMSGGLIWTDEFPKVASADWMVVSPGFMWRYLIAYRASITLDEERVALRAVWDQVAQLAPCWPGLREDRRGVRARKRLEIAKRREAICLEKLEEKLDARKS